MIKSAVVILNWNGRGFLEKYLPPLLQYTPKEYGEVIVADNGSTDGSAGFLKEKFPTTRIIEFKENYGFTGGYNRAFREIDAEYYVLINSDIRVTDGWIERLIDFMENNPQAGICMPKILSEAEPEKFEYAGACGGFIDRYGYPFCRGRILSEIEQDKGQYDTPVEVFWASGACMVVRSSIYKQLNGLDERFFAHMEEIDFCWRAKLMGYHVWVQPQSRVYHVGGGALPNDSPLKLYLNYRNNLLMLYKNLPYRKRGRKNLIRRKGKLFTRMVLDGLSATLYLLQGQREKYKAVVKAHKDYKKLKRETQISPRIISYTGSCPKHLKGVYGKSIVFGFFTGKRRFSQLKFKERTGNKKGGRFSPGRPLFCNIH